jgi:hypothetical protein
MIKINILLLCIIILSIKAQVDNKLNLKEVFLTLPEDAFHSRHYNLHHFQRNSFWALYEQGKFQNKEIFQHGLLGNTNLEYYSDSLNIECFINLENRLIRIIDKYSDVTPTHSTKIFKGDRNIIGTTLKYSDPMSTICDMIDFYEKTEKTYKKISDEVLNSFNFFTDNFKEETIESLNSFYKKDLKNTPIYNELLFGFTLSDTVKITYDFTDYHYMRDKNPPGLDENSPYLDGQFFTKKYIMENGKLRLAE